MNLRKLMSLGAAAATLLGVLAGTAATASASSKVTLTWWTWTTNPQKVIANFEKAYPNITIKMPPSYGSGGTFYAKLTTALAGGTGPDVTQVEFDHLPQFIGAKDLVNIAQYVSKYKSDFPAWTWSQVSVGSAVYAVPEDIGPMGLMYQPAVLKKYNLPVPATWAQFASDAVALHKADPSSVHDVLLPQPTRTSSSRCSGRPGRSPTSSSRTAAGRSPSTARSSRKSSTSGGRWSKRAPSPSTLISRLTGAITSPPTVMCRWSVRAGRPPIWSTPTCQPGPHSSGP